MKQTLTLLLAAFTAYGLPTAAADVPEGALPLTTARLQEPAAKRLSEQCIDSDNVNGTVSVTLRLDADGVKRALGGERLQVLDIHLKAGRKSATNVGFAMEGGDFYFTHMRFHRAQSDLIPATSAPALKDFANDPALRDSVQGAVITFVHASGQNTGEVVPGAYYYLDLYTADGVKSFTGYSPAMKVSDRRLGSVAIPEGSPAVHGAVYAEKALPAVQAADSNAKVMAGGDSH